MWSQRYDRFINNHVQKVDKSTLSNIYHVSEYCREIERNMQLEQNLTQPNANYIY